MTIYGAIAGGEGDTLENLFRHPKEGERLAQVYTCEESCKSSERLMEVHQIMFAGPMIFALTITLIKMSTLFFYRRLFTVGRFRQACTLMFILTGGWFLTAIFVGLAIHVVGGFFADCCKGPNFLL